MKKWNELTKDNELMLAKEITLGNVHLVPIVGKMVLVKQNFLKE